jgi:hypothetical protein
MDWNKLQRTLFALDPVDPAEDLRKLRESVQGNVQKSVASDVNYVQESVEVPQGSMPVEGNYSLSDFAALAGITLTEAQKNATRDKLVSEDFKDAFKAGAANYNNMNAFSAGMDAFDNDSTKPKSKSSEKRTVDKVSKKERPNIGSTEPGAWRSFLKQHTAQLQQIAADPEKKKRFDTWMSKWAESVEEAEVMKFKVPTVKQRDPNWRDMEALRKSGAAGSHKDKKKDTKFGKVKHKGQQYESIKDMLYAKLNGKK